MAIATVQLDRSREIHVYLRYMNMQPTNSQLNSAISCVPVLVIPSTAEEENENLVEEEEDEEEDGKEEKRKRTARRRPEHPGCICNAKFE